MIKSVINDLKWKALRAHLKKIGREGAHVKVGILASTNAPVAGTSADLVTIAAAHELGTPTLPQRSFLKAGLEDKRSEHEQLLIQLWTKILSMTMSVDQALGILGLWSATTIRKFVTSGQVKPPLQPKTIARKGSSTPLVDTGQLINAISWEVVG